MIIEKKNKLNFKTRKRNIYKKRKICKFCKNHNNKISYKDVNKLKKYISERGKIVPKRTNGNCAKHQRILTKEIKKARYLAIIPYV